MIIKQEETNCKLTVSTIDGKQEQVQLTHQQTNLCYQPPVTHNIHIHSHNKHNKIKISQQITQKRNRDII